MIGFPDSSVSSPSWARRRVAPAFAERGMVAAAHPLTVATGLEILRQGGNAIDAAVGAGLAAAVVMPEMCGLGGDLFAVIHAPGKDVVSVQGSGIAPRGATLEGMRRAGEGRMPARGPLSVAVPGMVDAYFALLDRYGTRSFAEVAEPAIGYADGFPIHPLGAACIGEFKDLLAQYPASRDVFLPGGEVPVPGTMFRQPGLARTLRTLAAEGVDAFYRGDIARQIDAFMTEVGGALRASDLADHTTEITPPISTCYRGHTVYQTCLPSQGLILLGALNIAQRSDMAKTGAVSAEGIHVLAEAKKLAFADRVGWTTDPAFGASPVEQLLSEEWAARRHAAIDPRRAATLVPRGEQHDGNTTYLCVVDGDGMMVSLIQSVAANFGSGLVAGDTGIVLNNRASAFTVADGHPNVFAPGKKTIHTLNCYLIADPEGRPVLVGGTPGGDGQPQWNLQSIVGMVDEGWDVQQVAEQPRWASWPGSAPVSDESPYTLQIEQRAGQEVIDQLAVWGHRMDVVGDWGCGGAVQIIARDPETGVLAGGSDPRVEGLAMGW
ncbi:MAG TPA: gamma-glutamyltransferase [Thermomicrobiales bacterium]|nr:gamma-glutamyltransferase [Thermomicrobiales bacterium]